MKPTKILKNALPGLLLATIVQAADHVESPAATADRPADLADIFFFDPEDTEGRLVAIITYGCGWTMYPEPAAP